MAIQNLRRYLFRATTSLVHQQSHRQLSHALWLANGLIFLLSVTPANAQLRVVTDGSTTTTLTGSTDCTATCFITGTSIAGDNLFHSFSEFSIPDGVSVIFNDGGATNIFSRVSDPTQASNILGNLVVGPGAANFFLINPAGINFGPNAELSLNGGAFIASTAERVNFLNGDEFIAGSSTEPVQLTVSTPVGLQFGSTAASIVNQSQAASFVNTLGAPAGLFNLFDTLALIGGDINLLGGNLTAPGGNIALGSVGPGSIVNLSAAAQGFEFGYDTVDTYQDIQILGSVVDVGGPGGGQVNLQGNEVTLNSSGIFGVTLGPFEGGELNLNATQLNLINASAIQGITTTVANGPDVNLRVDELNMTDGSVLSTETKGPGDSGHVTIQGQSQLYANTVDLNASALGAEVGAGATGQGGNVTIETTVLNLQNSAGILVNTFGPGNGGNLYITALNESILQGSSSLQTNTNEFQQNPAAPAGIGIVTSNVGNAGNIQLTTEQLTVQDGSQIAATTFGNAGNGGQVTVTADTVSLVGTSEDIRASSILSQVEPGEITGNLSTSQGGDILIRARLLSLTGQAAISATAFGAGNAGNITLQDMERLEITGDEIQVPGLFAIGQGDGKAGVIDITADQIRLVFRAQITASTETTDGGDVILRGAENIILRDTSRVSARAGDGGSGGNITIETPFLIAIPEKDSDIIATAVNGLGGNIQITAFSILGLAERPATTGNGTNDIDASSQYGTDGTVIINRPYAEPDQGLTNLSGSLADATNQVGKSCGTTNSSTTGRFTVTGRGGLPPAPEASLQERHTFVDFGYVSPESAQLTSAETLDMELVTQSPSSQSPQTIEAQGWIADETGKVTLISQSINSWSNKLQQPYSHCQ
ncbi:MAG: filamentous hemagglutinin N-terminal domain-containing protein [Leptolyngbya sp. SIO3F4]|nr:filamentous hemagglutinin N-terminal domain-containing protein [Leptolyngbya sp. SIO3F4]